MLKPAPFSSGAPADTRPAASNHASAAASTAPGVPASGTRPGCLDSTDILRGHRAVEISHNGATYRLQATRQGKLILTK